jgi:hypothetical protein
VVVFGKKNVYLAFGWIDLSNHPLEADVSNLVPILVINISAHCVACYVSQNYNYDDVLEVMSDKFKVYKFCSRPK